MTQFRQGDVLIEKVIATEEVVKTADIPLDTTKGTPRVVLAYGEVTGHAHAIVHEESMEWFTVANDDPEARGPDRYLRLVEPTELRHEEHAPIPLTPGLWKVTRQREYTPERIRDVAD